MQNITLPEIEFQACETPERGIPVIIVAAGSSTRMQGIDKQLLNLKGIPVIVRTLKAFERSREISKIILVTREDLIFQMQILADKYMISKLTDIVCGGSDRHASVLCGMDKLAADEDCVLIHDGARPFVSEDMIKNCADALENFDGSLCAVKISDTVKCAGEDDCVEATLDRSFLYSAQTPQGVHISLYKKALSEVSNVEFTDDASVLESGGYRVKIIEGGTQNIKITTKADIALAEALLGGFSDD